MTMDYMVTYLENRGFRVKKEYEPKGGFYIFDITKDGITYSEQFKYLETDGWATRDEKQREFLGDIVNNFNLYKDRMERKNEKMDIVWMVDTVSINNATGSFSPCVKAKITGRIDSIYSVASMDLREHIEETLNHHRPSVDYSGMYCRKPNFAIKNVIFNPPATIVFWEDGTKTVVQAREDDIYDPEKGLAMAITKKALGNKHDYYHIVRHWLKRYKKPVEELNFNIKLPDLSPATAALKRLNEALAKNRYNGDSANFVKDVNRIEDCDPLDTIKKDIEKMYENTKCIGIVKDVEQTDEGVEAEVEITDEKWKIWFQKIDENGVILSSGVHPTEYKCKSFARRIAIQVYGDEYDWIVSKTNPWGDPTCQE